MPKMIIRKMGEALLSLVEDADEPGSSDRSDVKGRREFDRAARDLVDSGTGSVQTGSVELLGMNRVREAVGDDWSTVRAEAHDVAESTITRHLGEGDIFGAREDGAWSLCFATVDRAQAQERVERIVDDIADRLREKVENGASIDVGHKVVELDRDSLKKGGDSLFDTIGDALDAVKAEVETNLQKQRRILERARVLYEPIWNASSKKVVIYRCVLDDARRIETLQLTGTEQTRRRMLAEVDQLIFGRAILRLHETLQRGDRVMLLLPVRYSTLNTKSTRQGFLDLCKRMPATYARYITFELCGIPSRVRPERIAELLGMLKPFSAARCIEMTPGREHTVGQLAACGAAAVSISANGSSATSNFIARSKKAGLRVMVHGVQSVASVAQATSAGTFVDGPAIADRLEAPRAPYELDPLIGHRT